MWAKNKYFFLAAFAFIAIGVLETMKPEETLWVESYSKYDKIPFGDYVLFEQLDDIFDQEISVSSESINNTLTDSLSNTNLLIINNSFYPQERDIKALLNFVNNGNDAMIISRNISDLFLDTLGIGVEMSFDQNGAKLVMHLTNDTTQYQGPTHNLYYQSNFDSLSTVSTPLGFRADGLPNFIRINIGKGHLFFHLVPSAFSNVFLLHKDNHRYISQVLSHLPNQPTIWDEYYKARKKLIPKTPFQQVLTTDGLRQALYLLLIGTLIYMVFASKRRQRIIPVLAIKSNTTSGFIKTMGMLYFNESDHKDIGLKRIHYFLADIRARYRIDTEDLGGDFSNRLCALSAVTQETIDNLITNFKVIQTVEVVLDARIIEQDKLIEKYYKEERKHGK